jgi:hypothetical protein
MRGGVLRLDTALHADHHARLECPFKDGFDARKLIDL